MICFRSLTCIIFTLICSSVFAEDFLCGDPPPVSNETLKGELQGKAKILSKYLGGAELGGKIETSREEVFSKYPNADRVVADQYLLYQTCIILTRDKDLSTTEKLDALKDMRREFHSTFTQQKIAKTCRHKDFGLERWGSSEVIEEKSGWKKGGWNQTKWCNILTNNTISGRSIGPIHKATVLDKGESKKEEFPRKFYYNYSCKIKLEWNPIYKEKQDANRCGYL